MMKTNIVGIQYYKGLPITLTSFEFTLTVI